MQQTRKFIAYFSTFNLLTSLSFPEFFDAQFRDILPADLVGYESRILPREHAQGSCRSKGHHRVYSTEILPAKWPPVEFGNLQIAAQLKVEFEALQTLEDCSAWITRKTQERQTIDAVKKHMFSINPSTDPF